MEQTPLPPEPNTAKPKPHSAGFFPSLLSVGFFLLVMVGMFFGFTKYYPQLAQRYLDSREQRQQTEEPGNIEPERPNAADIAPFVRGILTGMQVAQEQSVRDTGPLNVTALRGYQNGIRTAVITSNNWFNLDRQLFRVKGLEQGTVLSAEISKNAEARGTQENQIRIIQRIQAALSTDLEELLAANIDNRRQVLEDYLDGLKKLGNEANLELASLANVIQEAQAEIEEQASVAEQFGADLEGDGIGNIGSDQNLDLFLEARSNAERARIRGSQAQQIFTTLSPLVEQLRRVVAAIQANFDALAAGVKVTPVQGVNLPLFEEN